ARAAFFLVVVIVRLLLARFRLGAGMIALALVATGRGVPGLVLVAAGRRRSALIVATGRRRSAALGVGGEHSLFERILQLRRHQRLGQLDVRLDLQRLAELLEADLALLEAHDGDHAEVDVRARRDRVLIETGAAANLQRLLQQVARGVVVLLVV